MDACQQIKFHFISLSIKQFDTYKHIFYVFSGLHNHNGVRMNEFFYY